jgi:hypothetical protein
MVTLGGKSGARGEVEDLERQAFAGAGDKSTNSVMLRPTITFPEILDVVRQLYSAQGPQVMDLLTLKEYMRTRLDRVEAGLRKAARDRVPTHELE